MEPVSQWNFKSVEKEIDFPRILREANDEKRTCILVKVKKASRLFVRDGDRVILKDVSVRRSYAPGWFEVVEADIPKAMQQIADNRNTRVVKTNVRCY